MIGSSVALGSRRRGGRGCGHFSDDLMGLGPSAAGQQDITTESSEDHPGPRRAAGGPRARPGVVSFLGAHAGARR
jgi:hypothetical protein